MSGIGEIYDLIAELGRLTGLQGPPVEILRKAVREVRTGWGLESEAAAAHRPPIMSRPAVPTPRVDVAGWEE